MIYDNPIRELLTTDLAMLKTPAFEAMIAKYLKYILRDNNKYKVFKGIPREYTQKYIILFQKLLKINGYNSGELLLSFRSEYVDDEYTFTGFMVSYDGRGHVFGSFQNAYLFAAKAYLDSTIIFDDDIVKDLADNIEVYFGHVVVKNDKATFKDMVSVVNHKYYMTINGDDDTNDLPFE